MKRIFICLFFLVSFTTVRAQGVIMVCDPSGTICAPYTDINQAILQANNGDYIYLPGGVHVLNTTINKKLQIIGAGFNIDSTVATGSTIVNGNLVIANNAANSQFEGFELTGNLHSANTDTIEQCVFTRIKINGIVNGSFVESNFFQCIFQSTLENFSGVNKIAGSMYNCIFSSTVHYWHNSTFANNVFLNGGGRAFYDCQTITVRNNLIQNNLVDPNTTNGACYNMVLHHNFIIDGGGLGYANLILNQNNNFNTLCVDHFATCPATPNQSTNNYHLLATSPGKNAGHDGTDIGIYGGFMPWVEGSVPGNPHIYFKNISPTATNTLPVQIKVRSGN